MKLNKTSKSVKAKSPSKIPAAKVDEMAEEYQAAVERSKAASADAERKKSAIKELAETSGHTQRKYRVVTGKKFVVGYQECAPAQSIDEAKLKDMLIKTPAGKKLWEKITKRVVDEGALAACVESGEINAKYLLKAVFTSGKPIHRICVMPLPEFNKIQEEANDDQSQD